MLFEKPLRNLLIGSGLLPSPYTWPNPFKILEYRELLRGVRFARTDTVLDLGCGAGKPTILIARRVKKAVGIDVDASQIEKAKGLAALYARGADVEFRSVPLEEAGFKDGSFDKIVSFCVLEHIPHYERTLALLADSLKEGGQILLSVDSLATIADSALLEQHSREGHVAHYFTPEEIRALLTDLGFERITVRPIFRSAFAKRLFEKDIREHYVGHDRFGKFFTYARLCASEAMVPNAPKGIFLCVSAFKKGKRSVA